MTASVPSSGTPVSPVSGSDMAAPHTARDGKGIQITDPAMQQLAKLCREQGESQVLRVGVRSGGCSGMSYRWISCPAARLKTGMRCTTTPLPMALISRWFAIPRACFTSGMQLDFSTALIGGGFNFTNPNASQTCGCGSSFAV